MTYGVALILLLSLSLVKSALEFHLWYTDYSVYYVDIYSLAMTDDGYIYAVGCRYNYNYGNDGSWIYKFRGGTHIWNKLVAYNYDYDYSYSYCYGSYGITIDNDGGFLIAEYNVFRRDGNFIYTLIVHKHKEDGNIEWEYNQDTAFDYFYPTRMKVLPNENYAVVGGTSFGAGITVISNTSSMIWRVDTSHQYGLGFSGLEEMDDGSIIAVTGYRFV